MICVSVFLELQVSGGFILYVVAVIAQRLFSIMNKVREGEMESFADRCCALGDRLFSCRDVDMLKGRGDALMTGKLVGCSFQQC